MTSAPPPEVLSAVRIVDAYIVEQIVALAGAPPSSQVEALALLGAASLLSSLRQTFSAALDGGGGIVPQGQLSEDELQALINHG